MRYAIEGISEVFTKIIESPFPALGSFQEKSTRYIAFGKEDLIYPEELKNSELYDEIKELDEALIETYQKYLPIVKKALQDNKIINKESFKSEKAFEKTLNAKAFDIVRYLLPSNVATSLGTGMSTRTLETHISYMLSHTLSEARTIGEAMLKEGLKLSP
ncbi:MAG: FAD-dependent thymidylate synthase [bacterium]|nr:FAD-dependent thymidylate synthase [bacterium]